MVKTCDYIGLSTVFIVPVFKIILLTGGQFNVKKLFHWIMVCGFLLIHYTFYYTRKYTYILWMSNLFGYSIRIDRAFSLLWKCLGHVFSKHNNASATNNQFIDNGWLIT